MPYDAEDTIVALSTPLGQSLKAILRISGSMAVKCLEDKFLTEPSKDKETLNTDPANRSIIENCDTFKSINGYIIVKSEQISIPVTLYVMKAPFSFTKEDVIEIHTFGSLPVLEMILSEILSNNAHTPDTGHSFPDNHSTIRLAEPGEFTKRAFFNGRIDLTQAEAAMKLIRSKSDAELSIGISILKGGMGRLIHDVKDSLLNLCSNIEASIDFSDQDISFISYDEIEKQLNSIHNELLQLVSGRKNDKQLNTEGVNVMLFGRPNVGKSSLLNCFNPDIKSIVSHLPHTTIDSVKRTVTIDELDFNFYDNPGIDMNLLLPENEDSSMGNLEAESLTKNRIFSDSKSKQELLTKTDEAINSADVILFVVDGSCVLTETDKKLFTKIETRQKIVVVNKCDLPQKANLSELNKESDETFVINTSTVTGEGINEIKDTFLQLINKGNIEKQGSLLIANARQHQAFNKTIESIDYAVETTKSRESLEFITIDIRNAMDSLGEIVGEILTEDILEKIFAEFCIGK